MLWGSINEDSALVTYLKSFFGEETDNIIVRETGIWLVNDENNQSWLGSSTDGIIEFDGKRKTVLEIKINVLSWEANQFLTKMYGSTIIPQIKLEMFCTSTQECHYVVWTPVGTKVFFVERDDSYIELLLNYLYKFWNLACDEIQPLWHKNVFGLKQKSKEIATISPCLIPNSLITPNVLSHSDLKNFETIDKPVKQKCCKDEEWLCKLSPCEVYRKRKNKSQGAQQLSYQSYKYGSNGIHNSCHQDTFLEMTYHGFKCHFTSPNVNMSQGLTALLNSFVLREKRKFHDGKMSLWKWFRD